MRSLWSPGGRPKARTRIRLAQDVRLANAQGGGHISVELLKVADDPRVRHEALDCSAWIIVVCIRRDVLLHSGVFGGDELLCTPRRRCAVRISSLDDIGFANGTAHQDIPIVLRCRIRCWIPGDS